MSDDADLEATLDRAIAQWVAKEGQVISRFVLVAEVMDIADGERTIILDQSESMQFWDVAGMLAWAMDHLTDEEEEDE